MIQDIFIKMLLSIYINRKVIDNMTNLFYLGIQAGVILTLTCILIIAIIKTIIDTLKEIFE